MVVKFLGMGIDVLGEANRADVNETMYQIIM